MKVKDVIKLLSMANEDSECDICTRSEPRSGDVTIIHSAIRTINQSTTEDFSTIIFSVMRRR